MPGCLKLPDILLWLAFLCCSCTFAQDSAEQRTVGVLPVPTFGYGPETRGYIGGVALFTLNLYKDSLSRTSNAKTEVSYTWNRQFILEGEWTLFFKHNNFLSEGVLDFRRFPEYFYGIGNATPDTWEELYDSKRVEIDIRLLKRAGKNWFAGLSYRLYAMFDIESVEGGLISAAPITGTAGGTSSGAGYLLRFDSRQNVLNPGAGKGYFALRHTFFQPFSGSDFRFSKLELDGRYYLGLAKHHLLAFHSFHSYNPGNPPFPMMALLGSDSHMRGYYRGRYRDLHYASIQAEYRWNFYRRWGLTAFGSIGEVAAGIRQFSLPGLHYAAGGGVRFLIDRKERVNMRVDYAVGPGTSGFYLAFGEAF